MLSLVCVACVRPRLGLTRQPARGWQILNLVTFADQQAVGYFRKQGFTAALTLPPDDLWAHIKVRNSRRRRRGKTRAGMAAAADG